MDAARAHGRRAPALRPIELVLYALGGCTGMDVDRHPREEAAGRPRPSRSSSPASSARSSRSYYERSTIEYVVTGRGHQAVGASSAPSSSPRSKYCSVRAHVRPAGDGDVELPHRRAADVALERQRPDWEVDDDVSRRHPHAGLQRGSSPSRACSTRSATHHDGEIIVVDDGSTDGDRDDARRRATTSSCCRTRRTSGTGASLIDGFASRSSRGCTRSSRWTATASTSRSTSRSSSTALDGRRDIVSGSRYLPASDASGEAPARAARGQRAA